MILLGLGSNLGDRAAMLVQAQQELAARGVQTVAASSLIETPALLPPNAPPAWDIAFLNCVLQVQTDLPPKALLAVAKQVEQALGRQDRGRWGPREIDIDLLDVNGAVLETPDLQLPHPGMASRRFVLVPLAEVAPHWRHPVTGQSVQALLEALPI